MTNKELLAELKVCYELLNDIRENNEQRYTNEEKQIIWNMEEQIDNLYQKVFKNAIKSEYKDELKIEIERYEDDLKDEEIIVGSSVDTDYNFVKKGTFEISKDKYGNEEYITCYDLNYNWYLNELGYENE